MNETFLEAADALSWAWGYWIQTLLVVDLLMYHLLLRSGGA